MLRFLALGVVFVAASAALAFERSTVTIETAAGGRFTFDVELALTPAQHSQGLMHRHDLPEDAGMLFLYAKPQWAAFWMKNTPLPLDMLFIEEGGRIINIHANATPYTLDAIRSAGPVKGVLEINGGMAARLGVRPGDRVLHPGLRAGG